MAKSYQISTATDLTPSQFLMLTSLSMDDLKWQHRFVDNTTIEAENWLGNNTQKITVSVNGSEVVVDSKYTSWALTDLGKNKKAAEQLLSAIETKRPSYSGEELDSQLDQLKAESEAAMKDLEERLQTGELSASEKIAFAVGGHKVTFSLIGLNALFFIVMVVSGVGLFAPDAPDLIKWGANVRSYTEGGDWWRLFTAMFMHIGIIHLLLNMYALYYIGLHLEPVLGRWKFLGVYLATGICASLGSIWWHENTASAGASGAIFGLYGVFLALLTTKFFDKNAQKTLLSSIGVFVVYNLVYGMKAGIDNAAHIGGLVSGLVFGYIFFVLQKTEWKKFYPAICLAIAAIVAFSFLNGKQNDDIAFSNIWDKVSVLEKEALLPLQNRDKMSSQEFLNQSQTVSLPAWNKAKDELKAAANYHLTTKITTLKDLMVKYVDLRIAFTTAVIEAEKSQDWAKANELSGEIQKVLDQLIAAQKS